MSIEDRNVAYTSLDNMNIDNFIQKKKSDKKIEECFIHEAYQMLSKVVMKHQENH